jgi:hypothetical protein
MTRFARTTLWLQKEASFDLDRRIVYHTRGKSAWEPSGP